MKKFNNPFRTKELSIDLGTVNTSIIIDGNIVVDEPSVVAVDQSSGRVLSVGKQALMLPGQSPNRTRAIHPIQNSVITDVEIATFLLRPLIQIALSKKRFFSSLLKVTISIPANITAVETNAVRDTVIQAGVKKVQLIKSPFAAAKYFDLDYNGPEGTMIVDIGGGTTKIAVIAFIGIVVANSIRTAGNEFDAVIIEHLLKVHNVKIDNDMAEHIKIKIGSALAALDNPPPEIEVAGEDTVSGFPKKIIVNYTEIALALDKSLSLIEASIIQTLKASPSELADHIYHKGIYLVGGSSLLRGMKKRITKKTGISVIIAKDPQKAIVYGTEAIMKNQLIKSPDFKM